MTPDTNYPDEGPSGFHDTFDYSFSSWRVRLTECGYRSLSDLFPRTPNHIKPAISPIIHRSGTDEPNLHPPNSAAVGVGAGVFGAGSAVAGGARVPDTR